ncbi:MAG: ribosome recycling factor [Nevskiaceae bacterium]|nr:MAG: ribosome recycling factor [Nevskiaceae bacterium]TBR71785.1 MAG: ribosome recycling factor [Nevskiaceae bacterium]
MIEDVTRDATARMQKSIDALRASFMKLRTGRASIGLIDHLRVDYYGSELPLSQVASVVVEDVRTLSITPWEKNMVQPIEKAIYASDLGLTPNTAGTTIRINMPPLTEERRRDLIKVVKSETEQARVAIRNVRRDANQAVKDLLKDKAITTDDEKRATQDIQKLTDRFVETADKAMADKEREMMAV